ncbi:MAG: hypothetical protein HUU41_03270 [Bryobacteraceae bacterium]|nr:DUF6531 domain-containing protein [Bryobacterales bacterium]NUN00111.1 hypothetical protein [Bryobacteraceae bacterium]
MARLRAKYYCAGDPVDVVTGVNTDETLELELPGPIPFQWRRYYSSARNTESLPLGWGHTHEYDCSFTADLDGYCFRGPAGLTFFPYIPEDGGVAAVSGLLLRRVTPLQFEIHSDARPVMEFVFHNPEAPAPLHRLIRGRHTMVFQYTDAGALSQITGSTNQLLQVRTDAAGRITLLSVLKDGAPRRLMEFEYDAPGNLIRGTDAYGNSFHFAYDRANRMIRKTDRRGYSFEYEYDDNGRCVRSRGEDGLHDVQLRYLPAERTTVVTRPDGGVWKYFYDDAGALTNIVDPYGGTQILKSDEDGRLVSVTDPNGNTSHVLYSPEGLPLATVDPLQRATLAEAPEHQPVELPELLVSEPPLSRLATQALGHPPLFWERKAADRTPLALEYGDWIDPEFLAPPTSALVETLVSEWRPFFVAVDSTSTDPPAWRKAEETEFGPGTLDRDFAGKVFRYTDPAGHSEHWRYDSAGNVRRYRDRNGSQWLYEYTSWNLLEREVDPSGGATAYEYTYAERISRCADAGGAGTSFRFDWKQNPIELIRDGEVAERYTYDRAGNLIERKDGNDAIRVRIVRGEANLPARVEQNPGPAADLEYDEEGRWIKASSGSSTFARAFDEVGNRTLDLRDGMGVSHRYAGLDLAETTVFGRFKISYRRGNGVLTIVDPGGQTQQIRLFPGGIVQKRFSNGTLHTAQFDWSGKFLGSAVNSKSLRRACQYRYSPEGELLSTRDSRGRTSQYGYDASHRLVDAVYPDGSSEQFRYDAAANLLEQATLANTETGRGNRLLAAGGDRFEYDTRGNLMRRTGAAGTTTYEYDAAGRLLKIHGRSGEWTAEYDPFGRRIRKSSSAETVEFYWDGERLAAEVSSTGLLRIYVYAHPEALVPQFFLEYDGLDANPEAPARYFLFTNQIGAPERVEDDSGRTAWQAEIRAYGQCHVDPDSTIELALRFPGHYYDRETGLHYNRHRYYSPELGRYLHPDPIDLAGGLNLYAYTSQPLNLVDVDGLRCPHMSPRRLRRLRHRQRNLARNIRKRMMRIPFEKDGRTYVVATVRHRQTGEVRTVVTSNVGPKDPNRRTPHPYARDAGVTDEMYVRPQTRRRGEAEHAEDRLTTWAQENDYEVLSLTPTRPCCGGCTGIVHDRLNDPGLDRVDRLPDMPKSRTQPSRGDPG